MQQRAPWGGGMKQAAQGHCGPELRVGSVQERRWRCNRARQGGLSQVLDGTRLQGFPAGEHQWSEQGFPSSLGAECDMTLRTMCGKDEWPISDCEGSDEMVRP